MAWDDIEPLIMGPGIGNRTFRRVILMIIGVPIPQVMIIGT